MQQQQNQGRCSISDSSSRGGVTVAIMAAERAIESENGKRHSSCGGTESPPLSLLVVKTIWGSYLAYLTNNKRLIPLIHHQLLFFSPSVGPNAIPLNTNKCTIM